MVTCQTEARQAFEVIPAVDVLDGRAVRLREGSRDRVTIEGGDPAALARRFVEAGARRLHLVDLDGAFSGEASMELLRRFTAAAGAVPVQVGGGYRTIEAVDAALAAGAERVIAGTAATSEDFLAAAAEQFGERLVVAIDARDGRVAVEGWVSATDLTAAELAARCAGAGVRRLLVTATRRDGSLAGPDVELVREVLPFGLPVLAAGGVARLDDLLVLRALGCEGAVVGSALLRGRFTLDDALAAVAS